MPAKFIIAEFSAAFHTCPVLSKTVEKRATGRDVSETDVSLLATDHATCNTNHL